MLGSSNETHPRGNCIRGLSAVVLLVLSTVPARAAADDVKLGSPSGHEPVRHESVITERLDSSDLRLRDGDWVVRGPIMDSFHRRRSVEKQSLGKRILGLPIIRLLVPKPTPPPSDTEVYFVGRESSRPWASISSEARRFGSPDNRLHQEGGCCLISLSR